MRAISAAISIAALALASGSASATDYFVDASGDDGGDGRSPQTPFATVDRAVSAATSSSDVIHVAPGTYDTVAQWGPNLRARLVGEGSSRDDVVIRSSGVYRTLRMASGSWVENVTIEGEGTFKADKGGAIEMSGGVLTNCVVRNGTSTSNGGNIYMSAGVVADCVVSNGVINSTSSTWSGAKGVNVFLAGATAALLRCRVSGGTTTPLKDDGTFYYDRGSVGVNASGAQIDNCLVEGSACGGILLQSANSEVYSTTVAGNDLYGVWSWNASQTLANCAIIGNRKRDGTNGNWTGNQPNASGFTYCASESGSFSSSYSTLVAISEGDFIDCGAGDYHPVPSGALVDAGGADPRSTGSSAKDLDGSPRKSGRIDIGCYEHQKREVSVRIDGVSSDRGVPPAVATFIHSVTNSASPETVEYVYDFGDGTSATTSSGTISHVYSAAGAYCVRIVAANVCEEESVEAVYQSLVVVSSSTMYVTAGNGAGVSPYDTPETGMGSISAAVDAAGDGCTVLVGPGVYESSGQISVSKSIVIRGLGNAPEDVVFRNVATAPDGDRFRVMELNDQYGRIENVTLENGCVQNRNGGNLRLVAGVVSNCVIRGGSAAVSGSGSAAGGGVEIAGAGVLTHCVISNNVVQGSSASGSNAGGAVFLPYGAKPARISNCLVVFNRYVTSGSAKAGAAGIKFGGGNEGSSVENCTVAANEVEGSLADDSAGIYCTSWSARLRNNIVVGNYETGKDRNTSVKLDFSEGNNYAYRNNMTDGAAIPDSGTKSAGNLLAASPTVVFRNFAAGNFSLRSDSEACNAGTSADLALNPSVDLAGNLRVKFDSIDIGCYECQRADLAVRIDSATYSGECAPSSVVFAHSSSNSASPENVVYSYDFGDGTDTEETGAGTISHVYSTPGVYTVRITASNASAGEVVQEVYDGFVRIASSVVYVRPGNGGGTFPYDTPAKGFGTIDLAIDAASDGYTILLSGGVYQTFGPIAVSKAVALRGAGSSPEDVVLRNAVATPSGASGRVLELGSAGARIENLTLENGRVADACGGNLRLVAGVVSNCVIRGGSAAASADGNAAGGGVEIAGAATLTHCVVSNNVVSGTSSDKDYVGGAIYVTKGVHGARISNCLVALNRYFASGDAKTGAAGIRLGGSNDYTSIECCTVASNVVEGALQDDSAGIYCTSWYARLRDTIVVGNYETGKGRCTSAKLDFNGSNNYVYRNNMTDGAAIPDSGTKSAGNLLADGPDSVFRNFGLCDYALRSGSAACGAGTSEGLALAPSVDLAGNERVALGAIDIGCFERQVPAMTASVDGAQSAGLYAPAAVTFSHTVVNSEGPEGVVFAYDFGDGSPVSETSAGTISHVYEVPGAYTVSMTACNAALGEVAQATFEGEVMVPSSTLYVTPGNGDGVFPYDTPARGLGDVAGALAAASDGCTILVGPGVYAISGQLSVTNAVAIRGTGTSAEAVVLHNAESTPDGARYRVLELNSDGARVEGVTLENGCVRNANGGNLRLVAGVVSNCVIRGGSAAVSGSGSAAGGGVEIAGAGVLTHCVISNNVVQGSSASGSNAGGAVFLPYGAKPARISNCLVVFNRYVTSGSAKAGAAGIKFGGGNEGASVENCTVAANEVEGSLADDSAGIYCTSWSARLRNNIVVGNYETGKDRNTSVMLDFSEGNNYAYRNNMTDGAAIPDSGTKSAGNVLAVGPRAVFRNFGTGNFAILSGSAANNGGTTEGLALAPSVDLAGGRRVRYGAIDMGCYECERKIGLTVNIR